MTRLARLFALLAILVVAAPAAAATSAPNVTTGGATQVTQTSAVLNGSVNPNGATTTYYFEYGTASGHYTVNTGPASAGAGTKAIAVAIPQSGLTPATTYYFRLVASNAKGVRQGAEHRFKTQKQPLGFNMLANPNPVKYGGAVSLLGQLTGTGSAGHEVKFQFKAFPYTADWTDATGVLLTDAKGVFGATIPNLRVNSQFRAVTNDKQPTASNPVIVGVAVRVSLHAKPTHLLAGRKVLFSGYVTPVNDGAPLYLQRSVAGVWKNVHSSFVRHGGAKSSHYAFSVRTRHSGAYRVVVGVNNQNTSGISNVVHLYVAHRHH